MEHLAFGYTVPEDHSEAPRDIEGTARRKVILVDLDDRRRTTVTYWLSVAGYVVAPYENTDELANHFPSEGVLLVADEGGLIAAVSALLRARVQTQALLAYDSSIDTAKMVRAMRNGAVDYFLWPDGKVFLLNAINSEARRRALIQRSAMMDGLFSLSDNDLAILRFFKEGRTPEEAEGKLSTNFANAKERADAIVQMLDSSGIEQAVETATIWRDLERKIHAQARMADALSRLKSLTARERQVLAAIGQGLSSKEAALKLGISSRTIDTHRTAIFSKIRVRNVAQAIHIAIFGGVV